MLEFPAQELRKYFKMGDHVKVIAGRFEGDTGLIVRVEENFVILFSDLTMHEVSAGLEKPSPGRRGRCRRGCLSPLFSTLALPPAQGSATGPAALLGDGLGRGRRGAARVGRAGAAGPPDRGGHRPPGARDLPGELWPPRCWKEPRFFFSVFLCFWVPRWGRG